MERTGPASPGSPSSFESGNAQNGNFPEYSEGLRKCQYAMHPNDLSHPANFNSKPNDRKQGKVENIPRVPAPRKRVNSAPAWLRGAGRATFAARSERTAPGWAARPRSASQAQPAPPARPRAPRSPAPTFQVEGPAALVLELLQQQPQHRLAPRVLVPVAAALVVQHHRVGAAAPGEAVTVLAAREERVHGQVALLQAPQHDARDGHVDG